MERPVGEMIQIVFLAMLVSPMNVQVRLKMILEISSNMKL